MDFKEKALYHQIHPAKLGTDVVFAFVSLYFFWQHQFIMALALHFIPPIVASFLIIRYLNLEAQKDSAFGRYIKRSMSRAMEGLRFLGDIIMVIGAWEHQSALLLMGLVIILGAWLKGLMNKAERA
jgi:hypothetical protein